MTEESKTIPRNGKVGLTSSPVGKARHPPSFQNPLRMIGGFGNHKFLFVFEIPVSTCYDLVYGHPGLDGPDSVFAFDFGSYTAVHSQFPMKFVLYRLKKAPFLHFRSVINNDRGAEVIVRYIKESTLSVAIINDKGNVIQPEKLACCQTGEKGGLCFRIKDLIPINSFFKSFLTSNRSLILRIEFLGSNLSSKPQSHDTVEGMQQYESDVKYRNMFYQLIRDDEYNSLLRSWASNTKFANVKLRIQDMNKNVTIFPAHRVLLAAQSDALGGFLKPKEDLVILEGFSNFTLLVMLDYIYSGEIHCNDLLTLVNLAELGDKFKVYGLKDKCVRDICMMFGNSVTNIKHIVACYKLGELMNSSALIDKAIECFRIMKYSETCIDFTNAKALMEIAKCDLPEENSKILDILFQKSRPPFETVRNLVQLPPAQVKMLGTSSEFWTGYIYILPGSLCKTIAVECSSLESCPTDADSFSVLQKLETHEGFFEFVKNSKNGINLRVTANSNENEKVNQDSDFEEILTSLDLSKSDYLSIIAESIGITLKASLFDSVGRIITTSHTKGILVGGNYQFWEINSFLKPEMMYDWDEKSEMILRISFGTAQLHPSSKIREGDPDFQSDYEKYDAAFLQKVSTELYKLRLLAQLGHSASADATIVMKSEKGVYKTPVHAVILSAMSNNFEKLFTESLELKLPANSYSKEALKSMLMFAYGAEIQVGNIGLALELLSAADEFDIKGLRDKCVDRLCSCQLNLETCIYLYEIGNENHSIPLKDIAIKFFRRNKDAVSKFEEFKDLVRRYPKIKELMSASIM